MICLSVTHTHETERKSPPEPPGGLSSATTTEETLPAYITWLGRP